MALLTVQTITRAGLAQALATPTTADTFPNDGRMFYRAKNAAGSPITVTVTSQANPSVGEAASDLVVTVPATTGDMLIGPFPPEAYNDGDNLVHVAVSSVTSVTAGVFQLP